MPRDPVKRKASQQRYKQSAKGQANAQRYNQSGKGQARNQRYDQSDKGQANKQRAADKRRGERPPPATAFVTELKEQTSGRRGHTVPAATQPRQTPPPTLPAVTPRTQRCPCGLNWPGPGAMRRSHAGAAGPPGRVAQRPHLQRLGVQPVKAVAAPQREGGGSPELAAILVGSGVPRPSSQPDQTSPEPSTSGRTHEQQHEQPPRGSRRRLREPVSRRNLEPASFYGGHCDWAATEQVINRTWRRILSAREASDASGPHDPLALQRRQLEAALAAELPSPAANAAATLADQPPDDPQPAEAATSGPKASHSARARRMVLYMGPEFELTLPAAPSHGDWYTEHADEGSTSATPPSQRSLQAASLGPAWDASEAELAAGLAAPWPRTVRPVRGVRNLESPQLVRAVGGPAGAEQAAQADGKAAGKRRKRQARAGASAAAAGAAAGGAEGGSSRHQQQQAKQFARQRELLEALASRKDDATVTALIQKVRRDPKGGWHNAGGACGGALSRLPCAVPGLGAASRGCHGQMSQRAGRRADGRRLEWRTRGTALSQQQPGQVGRTPGRPCCALAPPV
jgi:hypothetical protein